MERGCKAWSFESIAFFSFVCCMASHKGIASLYHTRSLATHSALLLLLRPCCVCALLHAVKDASGAVLYTIGAS
jgi:hypothetical protein